MTTKPFDALIFDLDGTLIDSVPDICASLNTVLTEIGCRMLTLEEIKEMVGWGGRVLVEKALERTGHVGVESDVEKVLENFLITYSKNPSTYSRVFPGVLSALERFKSIGISMGICTNKPTMTAMPVLKALQLDHFFDVVSCGDAVPYRKPDGRHILLVLEQLGVTKQTAAMIGDSEADIEAAIAAGVRSVAVTFGYSHKPCEDLGADVLIDNFDNLEQALQSIAPPTILS